MAEVVLFHHALGLTDGVAAFADDLRAAGHEVHVPDLYEGRRFATVDEGVAHAEELGFGEVIARGVAAAEGFGPDLVYAGLSLGVLPAQQLAQQRPGARGALLYHSAIPLDEFGGSWPPGVPLQVHLMADDPYEDLATVRAVTEAARGELFVYEGSAHLFTDRTLADHDAEAAALALERSLDLLARCDPAG